MSSFMRKFLYFTLAFLMIIDFYLIFNAGNPNSLLRYLIKDTGYDVTITIFISIIIAVISLFMMGGSNQNTIKKMLERNDQHISELKNQNRSDEEIAESFLKELGAGKGLSHFILKKRVLRYLSKRK